MGVFSSEARFSICKSYPHESSSIVVGGGIE